MVGGDLPSCEATLSGQLSLPDITSRCAKPWGSES